MNTKERYIKRLLQFDLLGLSNDHWGEEIRKIYLVSASESEKILNLLQCSQIKLASSECSLDFLFNFIEMYNIDYFGSTEEEKGIIYLKREAFKSLSDKLGKEWRFGNIWENCELAFCKSIIGTLHYYGINRGADKKRGEDFLVNAANMGDLDALLWCLWKHPEKAREYMELLVSLPESLASPEWLDPWKEHYNLWDVKEKQMVKHKIGF